MTKRYGIYKLECNWADEIDINSFELANETDFECWNFMKENYPEFFETPFNFYIGSNQGFDADMGNGFFYSWVTLTEIPEVAYKIIKDVIGTSKGKFPYLLDDMHEFMHSEYGVSFSEHCDHWVETGEVLPVDRDYKANKLREKLARLERERDELDIEYKAGDFTFFDASPEAHCIKTQIRHNFYEIRRVKKELGIKDK